MKKKYYKLTDQKMQTHGNFQWTLGEWEEATGDINKELCTDAWLHCYDSPLLAVLHNPIHADIENPRLFEVEVQGKSKNDRGLKRGFRKMRLIRELTLPEITNTQRIAYSILCAKVIYKDKKWNIWADNWLSGAGRAAVAADADAAAYAAYAAATAAAYAAAVAAAAIYADAADAAAYAAYADAAAVTAATAAVAAAADAAAAAAATAAAYADAAAATTAAAFADATAAAVAVAAVYADAIYVAAADAAAYAAYADAAANIDLIKIAKQAMKY